MFWYYVSPAAQTKWNVHFEKRRDYSTYDSADEALKAACRAAEVLRKRQGMATGVRLKVGDDWRDAVRFGE